MQLLGVLRACGAAAALSRSLSSLSRRSVSSAVPLASYVERSQQSSGSGARARSPVIVLHGLLGSGRNWRSLAKGLTHKHAVDRDFHLLDLRNHGQSPHDDNGALDDLVDDVAAYVHSLRLDRVAVMGHSLGGKVAMGLALREPALVERLVVCDIAPIEYPYDDTVTMGSVRHILDSMAAMPLDGITSRADAEQYLTEHVPDLGVRQFVLTNLDDKDGKHFFWRCNLPVLRRCMPQMSTFPFDGVRPALPTLFVVGGRSPYVTAANEPEIYRRFPLASVARIEGAGHWVHSEKPHAFMATVAPFLLAA